MRKYTRIAAVGAPIPAMISFAAGKAKAGDLTVENYSNSKVLVAAIFDRIGDDKLAGNGWWAIDVNGSAKIAFTGQAVWLRVENDQGAELTFNNRANFRDYALTGEPFRITQEPDDAAVFSFRSGN